MKNPPVPAETNSSAGIYIHIPFCVKKCRYCDFYSVTDRQLWPTFVQSLLREITGYPKEITSADSLYIGGGTPSVLPPDLLVRIIETTLTAFPFEPDTEITLEVNPGTITREHLDLYRGAGVNRLNIGVQSFRDETLNWLGRCHTANEAKQVITWAQTAGFDNIGLDLIYGIPGQSISAWHKEIFQALDHHPNHLSCYMLSFEPGTPLEKNREAGIISPLSDKHLSEFFLFTHEALIDAGYDHYEISNFSLGQAHRSRHNCKYWHHTPYIGFGPAAHSYLPPVRKWNTKNILSYMEHLSNGKAPPFESETLSLQQLMIEAIYLGLRQSEGIDILQFETCFMTRFTDRFSHVIADLSAEGMLRINGDRCALTPKGMLYLDGIAAHFSQNIDETNKQE